MSKPDYDNPSFDPESSTWRIIKQFLIRELTMNRSMLEQYGNTHEHNLELKARIDMLKETLVNFSKPEESVLEQIPMDTYV